MRGVNDRFVPYKTSSPSPVHLSYPSILSICGIHLSYPSVVSICGIHLSSLYPSAPSPPSPHPSLSPHPYPWPSPSPPLVVLALVHAAVKPLNHHVRGACVMRCLRHWDTLVIGTACVMWCLRHAVTFAPIPMSLEYTYLWCMTIHIYAIRQRLKPISKANPEAFPRTQLLSTGGQSWPLYPYQHTHIETQPKP